MLVTDLFCAWLFLNSRCGVGTVIAICFFFCFFLLRSFRRQRVFKCAKILRCGYLACAKRMPTPYPKSLSLSPQKRLRICHQP